jgi:hypothetical protein
MPDARRLEIEDTAGLLRELEEKGIVGDFPTANPPPPKAEGAPVPDDSAPLHERLLTASEAVMRLTTQAQEQLSALGETMVQLGEASGALRELKEVMEAMSTEHTQEE